MNMSKENNIWVTRSSMPDFEEYMEEIRPVFESRWLTNMGAKHQALTMKLKEYLRVQGLSLTVNGHMALELALQVLDIPKGSEVITTPFSFASTTHAIVRMGLKPVFCDIEPKYCTLDPEKIEPLITDRTAAIMPVHVYGNICDVSAIAEVAEKHGLPVLYDAAHAFGESVCSLEDLGQSEAERTYRGAAGLGTISVFSFHATKVFHTIEGGAVCCGSKDMEDRLNIIRDFGIIDEERIGEVGPNAKMNEFAAAMGLCNLRHIDEEIGKRKKVAMLYMELLKDVEGISLNPLKEEVRSNYAYFPIFVDEKAYGSSRDELHLRLKSHGIGSRKYFYPIIPDFDCYSGDYADGDFRIAREKAAEVLTLPMYADLKLEDVNISLV